MVASRSCRRTTASPGTRAGNFWLSALACDFLLDLVAHIREGQLSRRTDVGRTIFQSCQIVSSRENKAPESRQAIGVPITRFPRGRCDRLMAGGPSAGAVSDRDRRSNSRRAPTGTLGCISDECPFRRVAADRAGLLITEGSRNFRALCYTSWRSAQWHRANRFSQYMPTASEPIEEPPSSVGSTERAGVDVTN